MDTPAEKLQKVKVIKELACKGGGQVPIEQQHKLGKLTARERIALLLDVDTFQELDMLLVSAENPFDKSSLEQLGDGVVTGFGNIDSRPVFVWAQDSTILDGTLGIVGAKKITECIEKALQARVPVIGIIDSGGERIEDAIQYPHFYSIESMSFSQVTASGVIPEINMVMGPCTGSLALFTSLADFVIMTRNTSSITVADGFQEEIGSAWTHARKTGCCDILAENDQDCIKKCRELVSYLPSNNENRPPLRETKDPPDRREEELLNLVPVNTSKPFDMFRLISLITDEGRFFELKHYWAGNLIVGFARMAGQTVGIIANNPKEKGGCMNLDASDKMARFVRFCDAFGIAFIWLCDCPAYLPAIEEETRGLIRHGSRTIFANSNSTVPQITVIIRKLYGGGGLAMPGTRLGGDLYVAWPTIERGLMGPEGAVAILYGKELAEITDEALKQKRKEQRIKDIQIKLEALQLETTQGIIDPRDTRSFIIAGLRALANKKREMPQRKHSNIRL